MNKPTLGILSICFGFSMIGSPSAGDGDAAESPRRPDWYSIFQDTMVEMTWPQVQQAAQSGVLMLVPVGVIEEHGPHMSLAGATGLLRRFNEMTFDDYREVGGVRCPFTITIKPGTELRYERMENNVPVGTARFDPGE